ncbi:regulatory iron-sulfur-containing complex subunit RicT [Filimonas effusa]|nr:regulatory iron-sulfur-containing complex subunit RicT [Filimonas effusa]
MNVHDWLMNLPFNDPESTCKVVEVSFNQGSRKEFYRNPTLQYFEKGAYVSVEGVSGFDVGEVSLTGELVRMQLKKKGVDEFNPEMKKILRRSSDKDLELFQHHKGREQQVQMRSRAIARQLNLQMKLSEVEIQADGKKATFFYTADDRVDFREMIKIFASEFKIKVEMRQIGIRQEAAKVGGIGSCGRELCCSTWLTDFKSVTTTAARYQNLSINQTKLSGQCGRLKCCLNYELDTYLDALQQFPDNAETLGTTRGTANLIKKDIFKNLMWYVLPDSNKQYPLTIHRVIEIKRLNARGEKVDELQAVEVISTKPKEIEPQFVDVVGQISLRSLERGSQRRKNKEREQRGNGAGKQQRAGGNDRAAGNERAANDRSGNERSGNGDNNRNQQRSQQGNAKPAQQKQSGQGRGNERNQGGEKNQGNRNQNAEPRQANEQRQKGERNQGNERSQGNERGQGNERNQAERNQNQAQSERNQGGSGKPERQQGDRNQGNNQRGNNGGERQGGEQRQQKSEQKGAEQRNQGEQSNQPERNQNQSSGEQRGNNRGNRNNPRGQQRPPQNPQQRPPQQDSPPGTGNE